MLSFACVSFWIAVYSNGLFFMLDSTVTVIFYFLARLLGTGQKLEGGGGARAGANMGRAMVFHASTKGRVKQFGACH